MKRKLSAEDIHSTIPKVLHCPCCGESGPFDGHKDKGKIWFTGIYYGHTACGVSGVVCHTCGLKMEREAPDGWPKGIERNLEALSAYTLKQAVEAWNKRI